MRQEDIESFRKQLVCLKTRLKEHDEFLLESELESVYGDSQDSFIWSRPHFEQKISLPSWIIHAAPEILFECQSAYVEAGFQSIPQAISSCLQSLSIDLQSELTTLTITGELCSISGLQERIMSETGLKVWHNRFGADLPWVGASIASTVGMDGPKLTMTQFNATSSVPDWSRD